MGQIAARVVVAIGLIVAGWSVGRAQVPAPDFVLAIESPGGRIDVECLRGCTLQGGRETGLPNDPQMTKYWAKCSGSQGPCAATVNGFIRH